MIVTSSVINRIYTDSLLRPKEEYEESVTVPGLTRDVHTFHKQRLNRHFMQIVSGIKALPRAMRYSCSPAGMPWIVARTHGKLDGIALETAERLLVMGIAIGLVRIVPRKDFPCDVLCVVIDDERISRKERLKPERMRRYGLIRWNGKEDSCISG